MLTAVVSVDCETTQLRRYETGGLRPFLTHRTPALGYRAPVAEAVVLEFLHRPPREFRVATLDLGPQGPPPTPPRAALAA